MWRLLAAGTVTVGICIIHRTSEDLLIGPLGRSQRAAMKERGGHNYQWRHNNAGIEIIPFMPAWGVSDSLTFFHAGRRKASEYHFKGVILCKIHLPTIPLCWINALTGRIKGLTLGKNRTKHFPNVF